MTYATIYSSIIQLFAGDGGLFQCPPYCLAGFVAGLVTLAAVLSTGIALIIFKQQKGLHSKKVDRGVYVYACSRRV